MGKEIKEGGMKKIGWMLFKVFYLVFNPLPRIIEGMNFVDPEGFLIKSVESQSEPNNETKNKQKYFLRYRPMDEGCVEGRGIHLNGSLFCNTENGNTEGK